MRMRIETAWHRVIDDMYVGVAWYRATIDTPDLADHDALTLHFEGVDENTWVWIDSQYVGSQNLGSRGWDRPFQLDVTHHLTPGQSHQITVRVRNSMRAGGIWAPIHLRVFRHADSR